MTFRDRQMSTAYWYFFTHCLTLRFCYCVVGVFANIQGHMRMTPRPRSETTKIDRSITQRVAPCGSRTPYSQSSLCANPAVIAFFSYHVIKTDH